MNRLAVALLVAIGLLAAPARPADACTCQGASEPRLVDPIGGATAVATNTRVLLVTPLFPHTDVALRAAGAGEPVDAAEVSIPYGNGSWRRLTPAAPLAADTRYDVLVDDVAIGHFTTGADADLTPPDFAGVTGMTAGVFAPNPCGMPDCWLHADHLDAIELAFADPPADAIWIEAAIFAEGGNEPLATRVLVYANSDFVNRRLASDFCDALDLPLQPGTRYCARVTAYDGAGNAAGGDVEACAAADSCAFFDDGTYCDAYECRAAGAGCSAGGRAGGPAAVPLLLCLFVLLAGRPRSARN